MPEHFKSLSSAEILSTHSCFQQYFLKKEIAVYLFPADQLSTAKSDPITMQQTVSSVYTSHPQNLYSQDTRLNPSRA